VPPEVDSEDLESAVREIIEVARNRVLKQPSSGQAWGVLGEVFLGNEMDEEARACFVQAERLDPSNPRWPYYHGGTLLNQGDREGALPYLGRALERCKDQDGTAPRLRLGETLLHLGRLDEAEQHFRKVLTVQPEDVRAQFNLGLLAMSRQDWKTARTHLLRCLDHPSTRQKSRIQLALVSQRLGDSAKADAFRQQAEQLARDLEWVDPFIANISRWAVRKRTLYRQAENLEAAGRFAEAAAVLQPMIEKYPDDYLPHLTLGRVLGQTEDLARAKQALRTARRLAPDKVQGHHYLSLVLFKEGELLSQQKFADPRQVRKLFEESADLARQALAIKGDYGVAHMALGRSLNRLGNRTAAIASLRQAVRCNPEHGELHFYLGEALADDGQVVEARTRLEQALRQADPGAPWRPRARARLEALEGAKEKGRMD
jgi:tetratricopeptide (TPR) repeat protein